MSDSDEEGISVEDELVDADSSEEELGDEPDEYEKDGFVVDTVDDGDEEGGEEVAPKKRKRRSRHLEEELDAEDMSLIAENTGVKVSRNRDGKFKRLKKKVEDEEDDLFGVSDEEGKHKEKDEAFLSGEEDDEDNWIVHDPRERRRASHYVGSSAIEEAEEIFDDREYQSYLTQRVTGEKRDALSVYKANFEPSLLEEKYITEKDKAIRELDFPERIQVHFEEIGKDVESYEPEESSLNKEAAWIYARALKRCPKTSIPKIAAVLGFILKDKYDIPLITNYRKDYYMPDLEKQHVWQIAHWDVRWHHLEQRKEQLRKVFLQSRENSGSDELTNDDDELNLIDSTNTEEEVNDLLDHFQLTFSPDNSEASGNGTRHRRPVKQDAYRTIKNAPGISELSKLFGLTAKQFGENMMDAVAKHQAVDHELAPLDLAEEYIERSGFPSAESVLKACRLILAQEIAYDPHVRQSIRQIFFDKTTLSTDPTILGKSVIDDFHPYWQIKRLRRKPVKRFEGSADFLEILKAQEEGLLTFKVEFPNESAQAKIVKEMENLYCSTGYSAISEEWNNQRRHILQEALGHLVTLFEKEIRQKLEQEAKEHVVSAVSTKLAKMLNVSPYISPKRSGEIATVMACCWGAHTGTGTGSDPTTFVMLNDDGQPIDSLRLRFMGLSSKDTAAPLDRERKKSDLKQLQDFILKHEPEVIAVGATELAAVRLVDDIKYLLRTSVEDRPIHYVDPAVPNAAKDSSRYREEFKDLPTYMRQTISLGRFLQDPLMEMASLCTATDEILCLKFHPLQGLVNHDDLVKAIHREFIIATNEAGVDINKAVLYKSASSTLQFVSGLGPRKALELIQSISRHGKRVTHRSVPEEDDDFESINKHLSKFVFYNAAPFLRIPERYANFNEEVDIISNTRIHPEDELFAGRMAEDALDERPRKMSIRTLMTRLSKSSNRATLLERELDLDSAAADWQQKTGVPKRRTLYDIRNELIHNYKDSRQPFKDPTPDELFSMLTSETDQTLNEGQLVTAKITAIRKGAVVDLRLESGLEGTIDYKILTEYARKCEESDTPLPPITVGSALSLQVERVNKNGFSVDLIPPNPSLRPRRPTVEYLAKDDPLDDLDEKISAPKEKKDRKIRRPINHPVFKNMTYQEVLDYFRDRETGEFVIRPSSRGLDHLTISWKLKDLIIHVDVQEKEKPYKNSLKIGKKLVIGKETYESLDELTERYIKPVLDFSQEMLKFRSFMEGRDAEISHFLKKEKEGDPRRIPYYVGLSYDSPGRFVLYYLPMQRVKKEFITVTPEGYRLRQKYFKRPDKLIQWFKTHFRNLPVPRPRAPEKDDWDDDDTPATRTDDRQHAPPAVAPGGWPMNPAWGGMAPYPPMAVAGAPMGMGYPPHGLPPAPGMVPPPGFPRPPWGMVMPAPGMGMPGVGMPPVPGQAPLSVPSSSSSGRDHHSSSSSRGYSSSSYDRHSSSSRGGDRDRDRDRGDRDRDRDYDRRGSSSSYHDRSSGGDRYSSSSSSRGGSTSSSSTSHQEDSWD